MAGILVSKVVLMGVMTLMLVKLCRTAKRKGWWKKSPGEDNADLIIGDEDYASATNRLNALTRPAFLYSRGLLLERRISRNDARPRNQSDVLQSISFPAPRLEIPTEEGHFLAELLNVSLSDIAPPGEEEIPYTCDPPTLNLPRWLRDPRVPRPQMQPQQPVIVSELHNVSLNDIAPPDEEEMRYICDPPTLKLPGWLRDPRLSRPPMRPQKPFILGPGLRLKTPPAPDNGSLHTHPDSSSAEAGPDMLSQRSSNANQNDLETTSKPGCHSRL